jgi:hypothetical protein
MTYLAKLERISAFEKITQRILEEHRAAFLELAK